MAIKLKTTGETWLLRYKVICDKNGEPDTVRLSLEYEKIQSNLLSNTQVLTPPRSCIDTGFISPLKNDCAPETVRV